MVLDLTLFLKEMSPPEVLGEIAMVLHDPFAVQVLDSPLLALLKTHSNSATDADQCDTACSTRLHHGANASV